MFKQFSAKPWLMLVTGLAMGLLVGVGMMIGALVATDNDDAASFPFPEVTLNAASTHGGANMAIATGPIDQGIEGLIILDFITGELSCSVLNPRTGQLGGLYKHNVVKDLGVEQGKQPKYLLVTGAANFRTRGGDVKPADSIIYVADANTGVYAAYMMPWNRNAANYNFAQTNPMVLLGKGKARNIQIE